MLEQTDTLLTIAEIAVAFAGFASIVSALGRSGSDELSVTYRWPLRGMIACSLVVLFAALFPLLPDRLGYSASTTWRWAGALVALLSAFLIVGSLKDGVLVSGSMSFAARLGWLAPIVVSLAVGATIAGGVAVHHLEGWYFLSLLSLLLLAGLLFGRIVMSHIAPRT